MDRVKLLGSIDGILIPKAKINIKRDDGFSERVTIVAGDGFETFVFNGSGQYHHKNNYTYNTLEYVLSKEESISIMDEIIETCGLKPSPQLRRLADCDGNEYCIVSIEGDVDKVGELWEKYQEDVDRDDFDYELMEKYISECEKNGVIVTIPVIEWI